jgi:HEAT repeats
MMDHLKKLLVISLVQVSLSGLTINQAPAAVPFSGPDFGVQFAWLRQGRSLSVAQTVTSESASPNTQRSPLSWQTLGGWFVLTGLPIVAVGAAWYALRPRPQLSGVADRSESSSEPFSELVQPIEARGQTASGTQPTESAAQQPAPAGLVQALPEPGVGSTTRLAKIDIVETLIADLQHPDRTKRCQAIWELGQRGDSRAVQPLADTLVEADSQQRGLILAAIAEISTRTLKPVNRALMLSLQDESADVRKNAIRDATRIYDSMAQVTQLLQYAAHDTDMEVQETAQWALGQLNRLRTLPEVEAVRLIEKSPDLPDAGDAEA